MLYAFRVRLWAMKTRREIVANWLPRYTGVPLKEFGEYILLTNFNHYVKLFAQWYHVPVRGRDKPMPSATAGDITIINFGMGTYLAETMLLKANAFVFDDVREEMREKKAKLRMMEKAKELRSQRDAMRNAAAAPAAAEPAKDEKKTAAAGKK